MKYGFHPERPDQGFGVKIDTRRDEMLVRRLLASGGFPRAELRPGGRVLLDWRGEQWAGRDVPPGDHLPSRSRGVRKPPPPKPKPRVKTPPVRGLTMAEQALRALSAGPMAAAEVRAAVKPECPQQVSEALRKLFDWGLATREDMRGPGYRYALTDEGRDRWAAIAARVAA